MFWQKLPAGMAWFMGRCLESTKKGPSDGCQLPVSVFLLLVNLDWNPWDFVAFKFNSITTRGFSIISGSNFPEGFPGVRYLTKLPSFKTTFWRGFNLENKFCFESTTTPHTHTHTHITIEDLIGNPIVGYYDIFSIYIYTHVNTGCLYTIPLYREWYKSLLYHPGRTRVFCILHVWTRGTVPDEARDAGWWWWLTPARWMHGMMAKVNWCFSWMRRWRIAKIQ